MKSFLVAISAVIAVSTLWSGDAQCERQALTPILEVTSTSLDFGDVYVGICEYLPIEIQNGSGDPRSTLKVTSAVADGSGFSIHDQHEIPFGIPGDGTSVVLFVRCCAVQDGLASGTLTISSSNAAEAVAEVSLFANVLPITESFGEFFLEFSVNAFSTTPPMDGPPSAFQFSCPGFSDSLASIGVTDLRRLAPWFQPQHISYVNRFGEDVTLYDLSRMYIATTADSSSCASRTFSLMEESCVDRAQIGILSEPQARRCPEFHGDRTSVSFPDDWAFCEQWGLENGPHSVLRWEQAVPGFDIGMREAWDLIDGNMQTGTGSDDVRIAVLDDGIQLDHDDLITRVEDGPNFIGQTDTEHGTNSAGVIGAMGNNDEGIAGINWGTTMVDVTVCNDDNCPQYLDGIAWALDPSNDIDIAHLSFSRPGGPIVAGHALLRTGTLMGLLNVAAMGNENSPVPVYPAGLQHLTLATGAMWMNGLRWQDILVPGTGNTGEGSNTGLWIDVIAPGGRTIMTTKHLNEYTTTLTPAGGFGGTSAAISFATGARGGSLAIFLSRRWPRASRAT